MTVHIKRRVRFSAAHSYKNIPLDLTGAEVDVLIKSKRSPHGHNFVVDLTCKGKLDQRTGMVVNITDIDRVMKDILMPLDQSYLEEDHPDVAWGIPTTENLARWIWSECSGQIPDAIVTSITVRESDSLWSEYKGDSDRLVYVTRSYEFAASHRLHSKQLTDQQNVDIFGKCNNCNGHGHNYGLEVTVKGQVDERTGMACNIGIVDEVVNTEVVERFDHKHLNLDVPEFAELNPTSENVAVVIWDLIYPQLKEQLYKVCVRETERNYFEYFGEE